MAPLKGSLFLNQKPLVWIQILKLTGFHYCGKVIKYFWLLSFIIYKMGIIVIGSPGDL